MLQWEFPPCRAACSKQLDPRHRPPQLPWRASPVMELPDRSGYDVRAKSIRRNLETARVSVAELPQESIG